MSVPATAAQAREEGSATEPGIVAEIEKFEPQHHPGQQGAGGVIDLATAAGKPDPGANTPCHIGGISAARRKTTGAEQQSGSMQMTPQPDPPRGEAKGAKYKVAGVQTPGGPNGP